MELLRAKPVGSYGESDRDNQLCRAIHRLLVPGNPEYHCAHLAADRSEAEGGVCIDRTSKAYNVRDFQCGYDDVGYVTDARWLTPFYPNTPANLTPGTGQFLTTADVGKPDPPVPSPRPASGSEASGAVRRNDRRPRGPRGM